ncbi:MAG: hypothetical protein ACK53Y_05065, partial [bacterium]
MPIHGKRRPSPRRRETRGGSRRRAGRPTRTSPDPLPAECCGEQSPRSSRRTTTSVASGATCMRRSGTATR